MSFLMIPYSFISSIRWFPIFTESAAALSPPATVSLRYFKIRSVHAIGRRIGCFLRYGYRPSSFLPMGTKTLRPYSRLSFHSCLPPLHPASYYCCVSGSYSHFHRYHCPEDPSAYPSHPHRSPAILSDNAPSPDQTSDISHRLQIMPQQKIRMYLLHCLRTFSQSITYPYSLANNMMSHTCRIPNPLCRKCLNEWQIR